MSKLQPHQVTYRLADTLIQLTRWPGSHNTYGLSAMGAAIKNGDTLALRKLVEKDRRWITEPKGEGREGPFVPFLLAAYRWVGDQPIKEQLPILKWLVEKGVDVHAVTKKDFQQRITHHRNPLIPKGSNALDIAVLSKAPEAVIAYLRSLGLKETVTGSTAQE